MPIILPAPALVELNPQVAGEAVTYGSTYVCKTLRIQIQAEFLIRVCAGLLLCQTLGNLTVPGLGLMEAQIGLPRPYPVSSLDRAS